MNAKTGVAIVVALTVGALVAAFLLPIGVANLTADQTVTYTTAEGDTEQISSMLEVSVDSVSTGENATITLSGEGDSVQQTIDQGSSSTFSVGGDSITVTLDSAGSGEITATYAIPRGFGWSAGAAALWSILDVIIILAVFLFFVGVAIKAV